MTNTTLHLVADIERLRLALEIDRWLVWGGSWGSTLGLAYAEAHPDSVSELLLPVVVTTNTDDVAWVTRSMGRLFPEAWQAFTDLPLERRDGNLACAYSELLMDPDPTVHHAAALKWCDWEDTHVSLASGYRPDLRDEDPTYRHCFARLVSHYWANAAFLDDDLLFRDAPRLAGIPTFLSHGCLDVSSPIDFVFRLADVIPNAELFVTELDGHGGPAIIDWTLAITDRLAAEHAAAG